MSFHLVNIANNVVRVLTQPFRNVLIRYKPVIEPTHELIPKVELLSWEFVYGTQTDSYVIDAGGTLGNLSRPVISGISLELGVTGTISPTATVSAKGTVPIEGKYTSMLKVVSDHKEPFILDQDLETNILRVLVPIDLSIIYAGSLMVPYPTTVGDRFTLASEGVIIKTSIGFELTITYADENFPLINVGKLKTTLRRETEDLVGVAPPDPTATAVGRFSLKMTTHSAADWYPRLNKKQATHLLFGDGGILTEGIHYTVGTDSYNFLQSFESVQIVHMVELNPDQYAHFYSFYGETGGSVSKPVAISIDHLLFLFKFCGSFTSECDMTEFRKWYNSEALFFFKYRTGTESNHLAEANIDGNIIIPQYNELKKFVDSKEEVDPHDYATGYLSHADYRLFAFRASSSETAGSINMLKITSNPAEITSSKTVDTAKDYAVIGDGLEYNVFACNLVGAETESELLTPKLATVSQTLEGTTLTIQSPAGGLLEVNEENPVWFIYNVEETEDA